MCGICGAIQLEGQPRLPLGQPLLDHMTDLMTHRGPNDRGTHLAPGVALGARRLSIVDLAGGHQPVANEGGTVWAAQNGELYNHAELRRGLEREGHRFESRCDTEVIPHLYEREGVDFARLLRGKFAIAVWDGRLRRGVLARDRLGIKPLYHAEADGLLLFASELKSLLATGLVDAELDYEALHAYLTLGYIPAPRTPLVGVSKLPPGHVLVIEGGRVRCERYWSYPAPAPERRSADEWAEGLLAELDESVRLRLMSDVPLGAMLSGGLDSSLIVALMARHSSEPVKTFSIGFREDGSSNELADARRVAKQFGTDHHELELSFAEQAVELSELVWFMDEPLADLSALGFLCLSELAGRHVRVALAGQGADELLGGYRKHRAAALVGAWRRLPGPSRQAGAALALRGPASTRRAARTLAAGDPVERLLAMSGQLDGELGRELLRGPLRAADGAARRAIAARLDGVVDDPLPVTLFLDAQLALPDDMLHYFDRASMAHSLEVRVPFLDHRVVEYCARIPGGLKVRRLETKHVLKRAARGLLPAEIVDKRKIGFFRGATDAWLRAQLNGWLGEVLLQPEPAYADLLDRRAVERLVTEQRAGRRGNVQLLLSIVMLEVWLASFLPRALRPAPVQRERLRLAG
jgi:asparagine synthase (glutamine-hydrolysing)